MHIPVALLAVLEGGALRWPFNILFTRARGNLALHESA